MNDDIDFLKRELRRLRDQVMPQIGDLYMTTEQIDPNERFGGTWVFLANTFIRSAATSTTALSSGGASTHQHQHYSPIGKISGQLTMLDVASASMDGPSDATYGGFSVVNMGNGVEDAVGSTNVERHVVTSSSASSLPPYVDAYVWKRTA